MVTYLGQGKRAKGYYMGKNNKIVFFYKQYICSVDQGLEIRQSTIYYAGMLGGWDKRIGDQESDVPSIIIFYTFYRLRVLKTLYFYFCNFIRKIRK